MLNPNLSTLNQYTFARLGQILDDIAPISNYEPILFSLGEPQKPTPKILSKTISAHTVESEIAKSLEEVQTKFKNIEIGSYPFFRMGKIGVSIVIRSTKIDEINNCSKKIIDLLNSKKIEIINRE